MSSFHTFLLATAITFASISSAEAIDSVTSANFDQTVLQASSNKSVFVIFTATWCKPCSNFIGKAESVAGNNSLFTVDSDSEASLSKQYGINSIPAMLEFKDGKLVNTWNTGDKSEAELSQIFSQATPNSTATAGNNEPEPPQVRIINNTGGSICYHPLGRSAGFCSDEKEHTYKLPIRVKTPTGDYVNTRQIMIVAGGVWKVTEPSNGWTSYVNMSLCTEKTFDHESGTVDWEIDSLTGIAGDCHGPVGYRQ
jgi:thiol-disulfide isomerase/thioredoxin